MIELVLDESKWISASMTLAILAIAALCLHRWRRRREPSHGFEGLVAMNLFYGVMIGFMGLGHLLAVTVKLFLGTLEGSVWLFYPIGLVFAVPAWWLAFHAVSADHDEAPARARSLKLNLWLGVTLLALGVHNFPLAAPAGLNIAYQFHSRRAVGWTIGGVTVAAYLALFVGSLIFLASGQSFEQFSGME